MVPAADAAVLDEEHLLGVVGGRHELVGELAVLFDEDGQNLVAQMQDGQSRGDAAAIAAAAHRLAGAAGTLAGNRTALLARELEARSLAGDLGSAREAIDILSAEVAKLQAALRALVERKPR